MIWDSTKGISIPRRNISRGHGRRKAPLAGSQHCSSYTATTDFGSDPSDSFQVKLHSQATAKARKSHKKGKEKKKKKHANKEEKSKKAKKSKEDLFASESQGLVQSANNWWVTSDALQRVNVTSDVQFSTSSPVSPSMNSTSSKDLSEGRLKLVHPYNTKLAESTSGEQSWEGNSEARVQSNKSANSKNHRFLNEASRSSLYESTVDWCEFEEFWSHAKKASPTKIAPSPTSPQSKSYRHVDIDSEFNVAQTSKDNLRSSSTWGRSPGNKCAGNGLAASYNDSYVTACDRELSSVALDRKISASVPLSRSMSGTESCGDTSYGFHVVRSSNKGGIAARFTLESADDWAVKRADDEENAMFPAAATTADKRAALRAQITYPSYEHDRQQDKRIILGTRSDEFDEETARRPPEPPRVVEAVEIEDDEDERSVIYAEPTKIGLKDLVKQRPIKLIIVIAILLVLGGVVGIIVYVTSPKGVPGIETSAPSMAPSSSPTLIQDDVMLAAYILSGRGPLADPSSPQFRAVGWISTYDTIDTFGFGAVFEQRYAMVVTYFSLQGEEWINGEKWLDPTLHECDWSAGIVCDNDTSESRVVTSFDATRNNLQGSIPAEIGLLTSLQTFRIPKNKVSDFTDNRLNSTLPTELFSLKSLTLLVLASNNLTGSLAEELQELPSLATLNLQYNQLTGTLPLSLDSIPSLDTLYLDHNQMTGLLPYLSAKLALFQVISLSHNKFSGNLQLSPNLLASNVSVDDFRLQYIDISYNELAGSVSSIFGFIPSMRYFDLSGNNFVGTFPSSVGWDGIEHLAAAANKLTGTVPIGYPTLTHLDFSNNQFSSGIPEELCGYAMLEFLDLSDNQLESTIPSCLGNLLRLRGLQLNNDLLAGSLPFSLRQLVDLEMLHLKNNSLTGTLPTVMGSLVKLKEMWLSQNKLLGTVPTELGRLTAMRSFQLDDNGMTGTLPQELVSWVDLENMVLRGNGITGEIPQGLCGLSDLALQSSDLGCDIACGCCSDSDVCGSVNLRI
ncbi:hypothetical protein MHU86_17586 [Fragilaria crotonensis]|nr:hypothetical protein MHU86_17586 [Fragilaria crotonensis]